MIDDDEQILYVMEGDAVVYCNPVFTQLNITSKNRS